VYSDYTVLDSGRWVQVLAFVIPSARITKGYEKKLKVQMLTFKPLLEQAADDDRD
tara:strand:- start:113 stop:277 length:165 start_codon:yes stop_codon:yes gene_type:complete